MNLNKNMNRISWVVLISVLLLSGLASATPSQNAVPPIIKPGQITNLIIAAPNVAETGTEIAIWNPIASPTFGVTCPLPGPSGGTQWLVKANVSGTFSNVSYQIPIGGSINITGFGDGSLLNILLSGGAAVSPSGPGVTYAFVDAVTGKPQTDNTSVDGNYPFSSCGTDTANGLGYVGTALFRVIQPNTTLTIAASSPKVENGSTVTFTYSETNTGSSNAPLTNVSVTDTNCPTSPLTNNSVLQSGQTMVFTCDVTLSTSSGSVTETAIGNARDALGDSITFPTYPSEKNQTTVTVIHPNIAVTKSASAPKVESNTSVTYTYVVTNTGDTTLSNVSLTDDKITISGGNIGTLTAGQSVTLTASATLTNTTTNTATVTGTDQTGAKVTNTSQATVTVIHPNISLTKTATPTSGTSPLSVTYTYVVNNTGDTALSNVFVTDDHLGTIAGPISLAVGASQTFTATATITATTTNIATTNGTDQTGAQVQAKANATVTVTPQGQVTRTQGFWATHLNQTTNFTSQIIASGNELRCPLPTGSQFDVNTINRTEAGFWASIPKNSNGSKRVALGQAKMQLAQQLLAAILNFEAFGSNPPNNQLSDARINFCGSNATAILNSASQLDAFNSGGDNLTSPFDLPPADKAGSVATAQSALSYWNDTPFLINTTP